MITGGTNTGVMKQVGDAMEGRSKNLVGIATWGIVYNRKELEKKQKVINYKVESSMVLKSEACLDHNHGYFLLFDDGSSEKFGREINFRSKLERRIMKKGKSSRSSLPELLCKKDVLINFEKFTGKDLHQNPFFNKVAGLKLTIKTRRRRC